MAQKRKLDALLDEGDVVEAPKQDAVEQETPPEDVFIPPSIKTSSLLKGLSYTHHSEVPKAIADDLEQPCVLGIDEAGRGPVLGPMVYGVAYLPLPQHRVLLADEYHFDDSKVLTPEVRSSLLEQWCTKDSNLHSYAGWSVRLLSARDISSGMLRPARSAVYNLNQQAMDATVSLIQEVMDKGINVAEIYVDTIGQPEAYQRKLERIFPAPKITVAKKADSLYPCVSAASVAAKVTRDAALQVLWRELHGDVAGEDGTVSGAKTSVIDKPKKTSSKKKQKKESSSEHSNLGWGSGYPSDSRCSGWLKKSMHPLFGWGQECRLSWGTAKDMLEEKGGVKVQWPEVDDEEAGMRISRFFSGREEDGFKADDVDPLLEDKWGSLSSWYGSSVTANSA